MDSIRARPQSGIHCTPLISFQRLLAQALLIHADEPLRGRTEDDWRLVTPAARIAVLHFFNVQQRAAGAQHVDNNVVRFEDVDAVQRRVGAGAGKSRPAQPGWRFPDRTSG